MLSLPFVSNASHAQSQIIPPLDKIELMPEWEFLDKVRVFQDTPLNDDTLAYRLYLPKDWSLVESDSIGEIDDEKVSLDILGIVARFFGPPQIDERSFFPIQALELDYDITMEGWFTTFARNNGYSVENLDIVSEEEAQARYVEVRGGASYSVRLVAIMNGEKIIVARYFVPQERYDFEKVIQEQVIQNFKLLNRKGQVNQTRATYDFMDKSYLDYPKTWELNANRLLSIERMRAEIRDISPNGDMNARIRVHTVSRLLGTELGAEIKRFMDNFEVGGYRVANVIERHSFDHHPDMDFAKTEV